MNWDIQHIFMTLPISGITINHVFLPLEFRIILYILIAGILISGTFCFTRKKTGISDAFNKAVVAAFFASGLLYAVHADIGWTRWLIADFKNYSGLSTEEKLKKMDGDIYAFALQAKKILDDDYQIYSSDNYIEARTQYYLLPLNKRRQAPYIIVIDDEEAGFDPSTGLFRHGETVINNLKPVLVFAQNAYILKRP